jgi:mevalonate kinase
MLFDFANAFATFQIHINFALKKYLNDFCVYYLSDILIYFQKKENHTNHVRFVLKRLKKHIIFVKLSKCVFDLKKIDYLRFIVKVNDIHMNFAKIITIKKWVKSTTRRYIRIFIKFAKFYKKFIKKFNKIVQSLTNFFKKRKKKEFDKIFKLIKKTRKTFKK